MSENYTLPTPEFPKLDMPEAPVVPGVPQDEEKINCDGTPNALKLYDAVSPVMPPEDGRLRIMIGIPVLTYSHEFVQSFLKFWTQLCNMEDVNGKKPFHIGYQFVYRKPVNIAEIELVKSALYNKCTHILFMDDDIWDVTVDDLRKLVDADKDVVGGIMYASGFPYAMCAFRRYEAEKKVIDMPSDNSMYRLYEIPCSCCKCGIGLSHWDAKFCFSCGALNDNMLQRVDLLPFPFTLMKLSIFDKLKKPWFHCTDVYPTDSWFCDRCHEAGVKVYAHMGVRLNHRGVNDTTRPFLMEKDMAVKKIAKDAGMVNITPEEMEKHQYILHNKMKEAEEKSRPRIDFLVDKTQEVSNDSKTQIVADGMPKEEGVKVSC